MEAEEINLDGLIGPTHNYSGLSPGNIPSMDHAGQISNPKKAALEGLAKMHMLMSMGIKQAVLPPQERPFIPLLRTLGFDGPDNKILERVAKENPYLLARCSSAACMWTANAATMCPSSDSGDQRAHFIPANLTTEFHRSYETPATANLLHRIFDNGNLFTHHYALPPHAHFADEGAANHTRFCLSHDKPGVHLFVYGRSVLDANAPCPKRFPARQTDEACKALARLYQLPPERVIFAQQNPEAIDAGVFHNDVISVGNQNLFLYHEKAFVNTPNVIAEIQTKVETQCQTNMHFIKVTQEQISLEEAVKTYFFNSQIVTKPDQTMVLIAPEECQESEPVRRFVEELIGRSDQPIRQVLYQNLSESMKNGGGPGCLRFRVVLNKKEMAAMSPFILLTNSLYQNLVEWVNKHYRDQLTPQDLADPKLLVEGRKALDELSWLLQLGPIYPFQHMAPHPQ